MGLVFITMQCWILMGNFPQRLCVRPHSYSRGRCCSFGDLIRKKIIVTKTGEDKLRRMFLENEKMQLLCGEYCAFLFLLSFHRSNLSGGV